MEPTVPGVIVAHFPASGEQYVGSPALAVLPDGRYVAAHDLFGPASGCATRGRTAVYGSADAGRTWERLAWIEGAFWSGLYLLGGGLYLLGVDRHYGAMVIRRSTDGGRTWTPVSVLRDDARYHCAPVPVVDHGGRYWRAWEVQTGKWPTGFQALVASAPTAADLLDPAAWTLTSALPWPAVGPGSGWLEGNVVVAPNGTLVDILRVHDRERTRGGQAAIATVSPDGRTLAVDPATCLIDFPGGAKKFTIRHDPRTDLYWALTNWIHTDDVGRHHADMIRNNLTLICSPDLRHWERRALLLRGPDPHAYAWQYPEWLFAGDDLLVLSRTAHPDGLGGAHTCHDANYLTFHHVRDFRHRPALSRPG